MFNPDTASVSTYMPSFETAARSLKVVPIITHVHSVEEMETAIGDIGREPGGGLVVTPDLFLGNRAPIISGRPETTYRRSISHLTLSETAACFPTDPTR